ncbi:MAG: Glucose-6-phosphate isomerase [Verrucomicrobia subdivision 3 bacterium]|nr:Glucose-6-phosphate isomerase [Limisphaerales bacterium]MCS1414690.1 Glucose-6-phosphate isomerase [Limisphaerales bacterium]
MVDKNWSRYQRWYLRVTELGFVFDFSRMRFEESHLDSLRPAFESAFREMAALEGGSIANPDEKRRVGHYWLRAADLAPDPDCAEAIRQAIADVKTFTQEVHDGVICGEKGPFLNLLIIGIGGSALGPQFMSKALGSSGLDRVRLYFFDNTDPDGMDSVFETLGDQLEQTLVIVISKSGGTKETRNGMLEATRAYEAQGLSFARHAVAVTGVGSQLDQAASEQRWLRQFPMWDWVGGRTSELSAVGLLPAALQGIDVDHLLKGARKMDAATRVHDLERNPAAMMAALWYLAGRGRGEKHMVIIPYKDRLELFPKYLQQLVMESLGKAKDRNGETVNQGISVFGNKGSTDQHAYIQQLRDGRNDFFVTFIQALKDRVGDDLEVEDDVTAGDYLFGFLVGTQEALSGNGRESMAVSVPAVDAQTVGALIAVFERAVGFYASLVNINAYHQPGVEAGKKAAGEVIQMQRKILALLREQSDRAFTVADLAKELEGDQSAEIIFRICEHLVVNRPGDFQRHDADDPFSCTYQIV